MRGQDGSTAHENLAQLFHALSDPVRLRAVEQLLDEPPQSCKDIATSVTKSTFSHHLRILEDAGLVTVLPRGTRKYVSLSKDHASLLRWLTRTLRQDNSHMPFNVFGGRSE